MKAPSPETGFDGRSLACAFLAKGEGKTMRGLKDRVAVVTGAAGGIGRAICRRLAEEGTRVVAADINEAELEKFASECRSRGEEILPLAFDIVRMEDVRRAIDSAVAKTGKIDILVNNAGWDVARSFLDSDPELWDKVISINLRGPLNLHKAVLPHMIAGGGGKVVNIASDAGRVGSSGEAVYSACKGGLIAFSKTIARECARDNIRVNAVCPGPTDTPLLRSFAGEGEYGQKLYESLRRSIPLKRLGEPEDIPGLVAFLASDDANFITGQVISVSGGLTMHG
jgi:2-hydroxycyclohexanecarboxyl-CoA dehydrogenase